MARSAKQSFVWVELAGKQQGLAGVDCRQDVGEHRLAVLAQFLSGLESVAGIDGAATDCGIEVMPTQVAVRPGRGRRRRRLPCLG